MVPELLAQGRLEAAVVVRCIVINIDFPFWQHVWRQAPALQWKSLKPWGRMEIMGFTSKA